jgi:hypothetical protein
MVKVGEYYGACIILALDCTFRIWNTLIPTRRIIHNSVSFIRVCRFVEYVEKTIVRH